MKTLLLSGDYWHPQSILKYGMILNDDFNLDLDWQFKISNQDLSRYEMIILAKSNEESETNKNKWMSLDVELKLTSFVNNGGFLLVIHSGLSGYSNCLLYQELTGCEFKGHPSKCSVQVEMNLDHPFTKGCASFEIFDEHYFVDLIGSDHEIFLETMSEYGQQVAGWERYVGKGKVCVLTLSHNVDIWQTPSFQKMLTNIIQLNSPSSTY
ncbi:MAG: ThuA domain-containing protein [Vibrio sp.]